VLLVAEKAVAVAVSPAFDAGAVLEYVQVAALAEPAAKAANISEEVRPMVFMVFIFVTSQYLHLMYGCRFFTTHQNNSKDDARFKIVFLINGDFKIVTVHIMNV
jgi:hypothetical protein